MTDYAQATWIPNDNYFPNTGKKSFIILHGTAGGSRAEEIAAYFKGTEGSNNPVSSHYIVGKDGHVVQTVAESDGAWAQGIVNNDNWLGNPNYYCISIEHVKNQKNAAGEFDNSDLLTPEQQNASFALIQDICQRNGIGMHDADNDTGITSHASIDPVNRSRCPGTYPWDALWAYLKGGTMGVPQGWRDEGQILRGPNNEPVVLGFRQFVLSNNWDANDWPVRPEYAANPVEQSDSLSGAGTAQEFLFTRLCWTKQRGVYKSRIGKELVWYQNKK